MNNQSSFDENFVQISRAKITNDWNVERLPPILETSCRVVREFLPYKDQFIRVIFPNFSLFDVNDKNQWKENASKIIREGFTLDEMHYEFLGYSSSNLRERKAWFFAGDAFIEAETIRKKLGDFTTITKPSKCAARLGMSFGKTTKTIEIDSSKVKFEDDITVTRFECDRGCFFNGEDLKECSAHDNKIPIRKRIYAFTDGNGYMSREVAARISESLGLKKLVSAVQMRFQGTKGTITMNPNLMENQELVLHKSMKKFISNYNFIDVCNYSKSHKSYLNRQVISILEHLGIPNSVFLDLQQEYLMQLTKVLEEPVESIKFLKMMCEEDDSKTNQIIGMLQAGQPLTDPYIRQTLLKFVAKRFEAVQKKSKIPVQLSYNAMGVLDYSGKLKEGEIFFQYTENGKINQLITRVAITKCPALHPGDVRVKKAVYVPELAHLVDVVVFSQNEKRPVSYEIGGGDLDGDIYQIIWDPRLVPDDDKIRAPAHYYGDFSDSEIIESSNVGLKEGMLERIQQYFVNYITSDMLGIISNKHTAAVNYWGIFYSLNGTLFTGLESPQAIELATLFSQAVDAAKTGHVEITLPSFCLDVPEPFFVNPKKGYHSHRTIENLFKAAVKFIEDQKISPNVTIALDPDLEVEDESAFQIVTQIKNLYNSDVRSVIQEYEDPKDRFSVKNRSSRGQSLMKKVKIAKLDEIKFFYRKKLLDTTCYEFENILKVAKTCYTVSYKSQQEKISDKQSALSFGWLFDDLLNLAKQISIAKRDSFLRFAKVIDRSFEVNVVKLLPFKRTEPETKEDEWNDSAIADPPSSPSSSISPALKNKYGDECFNCGSRGHWKTECPKRSPPRKK